MSLSFVRAVVVLLGAILLSISGKCNKPEGYRAVIKYEDGFLAAGSDGQISWISSKGKILKTQKFPGEKFSCLLSFDRLIIVAGDKGSLFISSDKGEFSKVSSGTESDINSIALFNSTIIAGADYGEIISGDRNGHFKKTSLNLKGNIVSVSARASDCYGVTDSGEIIRTTDGKNWTITDFNKVYSGFYRPCYFTRVLVTENRIAAAGIGNDGLPVMMFSTQGNVWTERPLSYTNEQGVVSDLTESPNDILYNESTDEYYLACNHGNIIILPSCSHCNKGDVIGAEDLEGISMNENTIIVVGSNFFSKTFDTAAIW
jgi:hypothetical protein